MEQHTDDTVLKTEVARLLAEKVGPVLALDGATIEVVDVLDGVVQLRLNGVCTSCPSSLMTIIMGLEQELRQRLPGIEYIEAVP